METMNKKTPVPRSLEAASAPANAAQEQFAAQLEGLLEISNLVGSVMRLEDILDRIVQITADLMDVPVCSIYLLQPDGTLLLSSNIGFEPGLKGKSHFLPGEGLVVVERVVVGRRARVHDGRHDLPVGSRHAAGQGPERLPGDVVAAE